MARKDAKTVEKPGPPSPGRGGGSIPCVRVMAGPGAGEIIDLTEGDSIIGRRSDATVRVDEEGVSREHAKLVVSSDGIINLLDLKSTNGTYVNGAPVNVTVVREGDRIHIGPDVMLRLEYRDPNQPLPPPSMVPVARRKRQEPVPLSPRELEVAQLVAEGLTNPAIAKRLHISPRTVTTHLVKIYERLDLHSRSALTRYVMEHGLLLDTSS